MGKSPEDVFDYVIVGAGTAGLRARQPSSRAARCTRRSHRRQGRPTGNPFIHVPRAWSGGDRNAAINWRFMTTPATGARQPPDSGSSRTCCRRFRLHQRYGYFRGHPTDFDDWAAAGNPRLELPRGAPYFIRSENNETFRDSPYHGHDGPMSVVSIKRPNPMTPAFLAAMESLGFQRTRRFQRSRPRGLWARARRPIRKGRRVSTATAYLEPIRGRDNLSVLTDSRATRPSCWRGARAVAVDLLQKWCHAPPHRAAGSHLLGRCANVPPASAAFRHRRR